MKRKAIPIVPSRQIYLNPIYDPATRIAVFSILGLFLIIFMLQTGINIKNNLDINATNTAYALSILNQAQTLTAAPTNTNTLTPTLTPTPDITATPTQFPDEFTDDFGVSMRLIPAGEFTMGVNNKFKDERPIHIVYLDSYYIDKYEEQ